MSGLTGGASCSVHASAIDFPLAGGDPLTPPALFQDRVVRPVRNIVIVGGGTAGWLTAGVIAAKHKSRIPSGITVTLVESPDTPIIGVGEGTWPTLRATLARMEASETAFFRQCDAAFKGRAVRALDHRGGRRRLLPPAHAAAELRAAQSRPALARAGRLAKHLRRGVPAGPDLRRRPGPEGDLFIDCTGFKALLLGDALGVPFKDVGDVLFCDTALAVQVPCESDRSPIASHTISTAQSAGWIWDIGLPTRRSVGHVYSSRHISDDDAKRELRAYLDGAGVDVPMRKISIRSGHRETFWKRNCVAVGLAAGFLEPLEASAIVLIELSAKLIAGQLPVCREVMDVVASRFNAATHDRWGRVEEVFPQASYHMFPTAWDSAPKWTPRRWRARRVQRNGQCRRTACGASGCTTVCPGTGTSSTRSSSMGCSLSDPRSSMLQHRHRTGFQGSELWALLI